MLVGGIAKNGKSASVITWVLYFPMLVFSGATLPYEVMPVPMQKIVDIMPLTQGITTLGIPLGNVFIPVIVMLAIAIACIVCSIKYFRWE